MEDFLEQSRSILPMLGAFLLALPIAWNRERHSNIMGLRTFPLVAVGACAYVMIGIAFIGPDNPDATARIMQGLMAGIGFVGGGAILKHDDHVSGTASAASIWIIGAMGAAVGFGYWGYAVALSVINLGVVLLLGGLKKRVNGEDPDD